MQGTDHAITVLGWADDGSEFYFLDTDRYGKRVDLIGTDAETGASWVVLTEETETGLADWILAQLLRILDDGERLIPDHVAALRQVAEDRPYMDLSGVGINGYSYGGYMVVRAMLMAPEVYHVGVAAAPIADMADHNGNEALIGPPEDNRDAYDYASNLPLAGQLQGKLLMIHGTMDALVPFAHTMRMADAFGRAGKSYDLLVVPDQGHVSPLVYAADAIPRYFQEHLKP